MTKLGWIRTAVLVLLCSQVLPAQQSPKRKAINLPGKINAPFSDAIVVGDTVYLAGRIGLDPKTGRPPADIEQEAKLVLDGMKQVLATEGMTMDDLVVVQVYCTDLTLFDRFNTVYRTYFKGDMPARAFLGAGSLLFNAHFEVMGTARKTSK